MASESVAWERRKKQQIFWEQMADKYPLPFDAKSLSDTNRIIGLAETRGVRIDGTAILDIGCGTGMYSLPLARRAARVVGLDYSDGMLARFEKERLAHGIDNAVAIQASWKDADVVTLGLEKDFDVVWASMTPAVRDADDLARMNRCARKWCVYIGWGKVRRNPLLEEVFQAHDLTFGPPPGAGAIQTILKRQGIDTEMDLIETHWDWQGSEVEARAHAAGFVEAQGNIAPDEEEIREIVARYKENGPVRHRTEVEMGVLVWRSV
jgi:SAM-dependent methyltransferase